ncbi:MAG: glycosyltransferase [Eubacteriaceae bacterium]
MSKSIVLLTNSYPLSEKGETFINTEVRILSKYVKNIYIIPREDLLDANYHVETPENVHIYKLKNMSRLNKVRDLIASPLLLIHTVMEVVSEFDSKEYIFRYIMKAIRARFTIKELLKEKDLDPKDIILYSYWFHFNSLALALFNKKVFKKISRAHGYDFYKERSKQVYKRFTMSRIDKVYTASETGKQYIINEYKKSNIKTAILGVENNWCINEYRKKEELFIVSCSRLIKLKRVNLIIDSLAKINCIKINWLHIGDGKEDYNIKKHAKDKLDNKKNIKYSFAGYLKNDEVMNIYSKQNFDLFISLSESEGGVPVSMQEAQSFSIPIIATNVGGCNQIVNNDTGFLISSISEIEIIQEVVNNIKGYSCLSIEDVVRLRTKCRDYWEKNFDAQIVYKDFVNELLSREVKL